MDGNRPAHLGTLFRGSDASSALVVMGVVLALLVGSLTALFGGLVAITVITVVAFMLFAFIDYRIGILIAMVLLPLSASRLLPREIFGITGLNPLNATLVMVAVSVGFAWLFQRNKLVLPNWPRPFVVYVGMLAAAALHGAQQVELIPPFFLALDLINFATPAAYLRDVFLKPMLILMTAFLLAVLVRNADAPRRFLLPFFLSALVLPLFAIGYIAVSSPSLAALASAQSRGVLSVTGMHANELGLMFNMALALALFAFIGARGLAKWALAGAAAVLAVAVILTFSRGAFVGLLVLAVYFLITQRRLKILLAGVVVLPLAVLLLPQAVIDRATTGIANRNLETITAGRVNNIWRPLAPEVLDSPLIGKGLSSVLWSDAVRNGKMLKVGHPHNAYLGILLDLGILGAAIVAWFFWRMHTLFRELRTHEADPMWRSFFHGASACIVLLLVQGITDDRLTPTFAQTYLWLAYGIAIGMAARARQVAGMAPGAGATQHGQGKRQGWR